MEVKRLKRSLECEICRGEPWDTATGCGHLFGAECIRRWLDEHSSWTEDDEGILVFQLARCPVCQSKSEATINYSHQYLSSTCSTTTPLGVFFSTVI
jgi:Ring finger domain